MLLISPPVYEAKRMSSFSQWIPAAFPALALAHFMALLSPGPDFFLITGYALRYRRRASILICIGIALGNGIYITLAIMGWTGIRDNQALFWSIQSLGAVFLLWMGIMLLRSRPSTNNARARHYPPLSAFAQLSAGLASALLNPKNALFYLSLMTVILGQEVTLLQQIVAGFWMFGIVLIWDLLIVMLIAHPKVQFYFHARIHLFERSAGIILICLALGLIIRLFN